MCAKKCANAKGLCFICGNMRRRASCRLRYRMLCAALRRSEAGRAAPLKKSKNRRVAPIMSGVKKYGRRNAQGNIVLSPIIISGPKPIFVAPRQRSHAYFKKIFNKARPSPRFSGLYNFSDLGILKCSVKQVVSIAKKLIVKENKTNDIKSPYVRGNVFEFMCSKKDFVHLQYIRALYIFLMTTRMGKYVRSFASRSFEWEDMNNNMDVWLQGWRFELIDEIWNEVWDAMPKREGEYYLSGVNVPARIPFKRIWRIKDYVTDESVKQMIRYLIEELIEPPYWNMAFNLVF